MLSFIVVILYIQNSTVFSDDSVTCLYDFNEDIIEGCSEDANLMFRLVNAHIIMYVLPALDNCCLLYIQRIYSVPFLEQVVECLSISRNYPCW